MALSDGVESVGRGVEDWKNLRGKVYGYTQEFVLDRDTKRWFKIDLKFLSGAEVFQI